MVAGSWLSTVAPGPVQGGAAVHAAVLTLLVATGYVALRHPTGSHRLLFVLGLGGLSSGAIAGSASRGHCLARIDGGRPVVVTGTLADRIPGLGPDHGRAGARLIDGLIAAEGRVCEAGVLRTTLPLGQEPREAGSTVMLGGIWRRSGEPELPRAPERYGYVSVSSVDAASGGSARISRADRTRATLARRLEQRLPTVGTAAIAKALLLADRTTLPRETRQRFIDAGIVHLLAISGLHVGMIAGGIVWLLGLVERRPRRWVWAAIVVTAYVAMIGAPPAALRAGLVFWGHAYCRWRNRPGRIADIAGVAALIALATDPLLVNDVGFQLSFAGFAGVLAGHRLGSRVAESTRWTGKGSDRPWWAVRMGALADGMVSSTGAFLLTAPIAAVHFGRVVATSIPASVVSTGLVALAIPSVGAAALLPEPLGSLAGASAGTLLVGLEALAGAFAGVPLRWRVGAATGWGWVAVSLLAAAALGGRRRYRVVYGVAVAAALAFITAKPTISRVAGAGTPLLCHLAVGQGDAAVVRTGAGRWLVFDGGPGTSILEGRSVGGGELRGFGRGDAGRDVIAPFLRARGAREIELFALSHPHLDHFGGSGALFEGFRVHHVLDPGVPEPSAAYLAFLERMEEEHAVWVRGVAGDVLSVDDLRLEVLWPLPGAGADANETSLSFRLDLGPLSYVNTGDAPVETERHILERTAAGALRADVLKLGHHGSKTSSSVPWLRAVRPRVAVMSLSRDNRYGHPHAETLARLDSAGVARVWRTDVHGTFCAEVTGDGWRIVRP